MNSFECLIIILLPKLALHVCIIKYIYILRLIVSVYVL